MACGEDVAADCPSGGGGRRYIMIWGSDFQVVQT
jgi:hypothetical protein